MAAAEECGAAARGTTALSILNPNPGRLPGPSLLHELVRRESVTADQEGTTAPAIDFLSFGRERSSLSYEELHAQAERLAARIDHAISTDHSQNQTENKDDDDNRGQHQQLIVPLLIPQCPALYVSQLAVLRAGGAFCSLNLDAPPERVRFILEDVSARVVLTTAELAAKIPPSQGQVDIAIVLVDDVTAGPDEQESHNHNGATSPLLLAAQPPPPPPPPHRRVAKPSDLAYVMYTSGSTGTPKGVGISHSAATQSLLAHDAHIPPFSRFLQFAAPTFDVSVFEIFFPLFRGATLVSCARSAMLDDLPGVLREMGVDACELTPTVAGSLLRERENAPGLKLLLTIGEMLTAPVIHEFGGSGGEEVEVGRESMLWAMYGPTEATIHCTLQPAIHTTSTVNNIGFPLSTVSAYILAIPDPDTDTNSPPNPDPDGAPLSPEPLKDPTILPIGETGELAIGGHQLAEGYINRSSLTASAFIDTLTHGRLYRTGDKARLRPDGVLECLGRISEGQVKLRGQRIELGEVEAATLRIQGCHGAVAAVVGGGSLVVFCTVDDGGEGDGEITKQERNRKRVMEACARWLPRFMLPNEVVLLDEFPRLPSGKVDRKRLVAEYEGARRRQQTDADSPLSGAVAFRDDLERDLCLAAREILGVEMVVPSTALTSVGMDSILAIRFAAQLRQAGNEISAIDVLAARTITHLHTRISSRRLQGDDVLPAAGTGAVELNVAEKAAASVATTISTQHAIDSLPLLLEDEMTAANIDSVVPCTPLQEAMLAETAQSPQAYCNWIELEFLRDCSPQQVLAVFQELARKNEILRTGFVHLDGRFAQVIWRELPGQQVTVVEQGGGKFDTESFKIQSDEDLLHHPLKICISHSADTGTTSCLLSLHHALYDGWSTDILLSDLNELRLRGHELSKSSKRPQFRDVVAYHASATYQQAADDARAFWAEQLLGFQPPPFPQLRTTNTPPASRPHPFEFSFDFAPDELRSLSNSLGCGTQVLFQACLAWLWSSIIGSADGGDVVLGSVTSGRTIPVRDVEMIMGPCLASVPLRVKLGEVSSVRELLAYLHAANRSLLPHSVLPLGEIRKAAGLTPPSQTLYDVLFVYQESLFSSQRRRGGHGGEDGMLVRVVGQQDFLETKILVEVEPRSENFLCRITHHADYVPEDFVHVMGAQLRCLLKQLVENLDSDIDTAFRRGGNAYPDTLLSAHNTNPSTFRGCADLARSVESTAEKCPDQPAVCFAKSISDDSTMDSQAVTYRELNSLANRIGHCIRTSLASGVATTGVVAVAIIMEKSIDLYAGILGILKAGCAYLPLLPSTPLARIQLILEHAGVQICITDSATKPKLENQLPSCCTLLLDIQALDLQVYPDTNLNTTPDPTRVANIVYTSGTTGVPKGVCVTQLNIVSNLDVLSRIYPNTLDPRLLQSCSQAFDVSVFEIFFAWSTGMCLCSASNDTLFEDLERAIRALRVTHLSMTPTVAALVSPENVPGVQFLVTSGEAMTEPVARKWGNGILYQGYGPSETTNICTVRRMAEGDTIQHLGVAFENTSAFVLPRETQQNPGRRASMDPVPRGGLGELCFGGDQVVQGYLGMPDLTAEKFVNHPRYGRLYRSGDLGRMLPDGSLMILGRADDQVKVRGQRVELREIDAMARSCGGVGTAVTLVISRNGDETSKQLATFYVPAATEHYSRSAAAQGFLVLSSAGDDEMLDIGPLRDSLSALLTSRLPAYMVPSYLIPISAIPLTASGKVDKDRFRSAFGALTQEALEAFSSAALGSTQQEGGDEAWTETERAITQVISQSVGVDEKDVHRWTPFVSLGLDSISAIAVARRLQERLGARVPVSQILQSSCVARLGRIADETTSTNSSSLEQVQSLSPSPSGSILPQLFPEEFITSVRANFSAKSLEIETVLPCTPLQEAMLAASGSAGRSSYLNQMVFRLSSAVDPARMRWCWEEMVRRHAILRTCFVTTEQSRHAVAQVALRNWLPSWESYDAGAVQQLLADCLEAHAEGLSDPLDSFVPPVSFAFVRRGAETLLVFTCHHALYDGVAVGRVLQEVEILVAAKGSDLPPPPEYAPFLREMLDLPKSTDGFWAAHLAGFKPVSLPHRSSSGNHQTMPSSETVQLGLRLNDLHSRLKELGVSLLALCQASWAMVLSSLLGTPDVCFGNVISGRSVPVEGINELVAPCFNTIPVRVDTSERGSNIDLAKLIQRRGLEGLRYQFTPLRRIQTLVSNQSGRSSGSRLLFDTLLLLQQPPRPLDESVWTLERDEGAMDVPAVCEVTPKPQLNRISVTMHRDGDRVSANLASWLLRAFEHALETVLRHPAGAVMTRETLPQEEQLEALDLEYDSSSVALSATGRSASPWTIPDSMTTYSEAVWTTTESAVRSVMEALLSTTSKPIIRRETTIYQLGLDSISAVQIAAALRKQGFSVSSIDVMEYSTCAELAEFLDASASLPQPPRSNPEPTVALYDLKAFHDDCWLAATHGRAYGKDDVEAVLPCTPLQHGMLTEFINSQGQNYFNFLELRFSLEVSRERLVSAWGDVAAHHDMLRTGFASVDHQDASFAMLRLRHSAVSDRITVFMRAEEVVTFTAKAWREEARRECFDALHRPPWKVAVVETETRLSVHLAIHHALYDAQSLHAIFSDLERSLRDQNKPLPRTSAETAVSYLMHRSRAGRDEAEQFWKELGPRVTVNKFPVMTPLRIDERAIVVESAASRLPFRHLEEATRRAGCSIQAVIQAAWARLLCAYLGESSCVFGVVLSGRDSEATQDAPFPCITTLPIVAENKSSNGELVTDMMVLNAQLRRHQHTPLTQVQKWLGFPNARLFDTLLVYQKITGLMDSTGSATPSGGTGRLWEMVDDVATIDYPVSMEVESQGADALNYRITFFDDVLPREQARVLLQQFDAMVCHVALRPDAAEDDLWIESPVLYSIAPAEQPELPTEVKFLHQFVERRAIEWPERTALEFVSSFDGEEQPIRRCWTYKELDENGNRVANILAPHTEVGGIVAVYFDKSPEAYFSILGALKAGCAFVALDPKAPPARKQFILEDSGATVLLTDVITARTLDFVVAVPVAGLDESVIMASSASTHAILDRRAEGLSAQDRCYCLYTSGTTGTPKGCEITHENAVQAMLAFQHLFAGHWDDASKCLQFASFHFDVSVLEQYWSWSVGITVVAAPRDVILEDLEATILRLGITHIDLTPSLARLVHPDEVPSLCRGVFITGGEQLKQEILDVWGQHSVIYNAYGPTEATIGVTMYQRVPQNGRSTNIGRQFPNVGSYVFKPGTETPVARGGVGELCVSGKLVGRGYLNRDDLTRERFPTLTVASLNNERVYRTGDLVRILHDGCFDFLGRADDQVKLRGQRLEIGEINHAIRAGAPEVEDVATLVIRDEKRSKDFLVSFAVAKNTAITSHDLVVVMTESALALSRDVQEACRSKLPAYMVPTYVLQLPFIPLSSNNKAEVKELRKLFNGLTQEQLVAASAFPGPGGAAALGGSVARRVVAALRAMHVLEDDVGQQRNLAASMSIFELGIDSISVLRLSRALKRGGLDKATPSLILKHPVLGNLVRVLQTQQVEDDGDEASASSVLLKDLGSILEARQLVEACQHRNRAQVCRTLGLSSSDQIEYIAPCSALQAGMISRSKTDEHRNAYFNVFTYELHADVDVPRLKTAWKTIVDSFSILRTRFISSTEGFVQVALKEVQQLPWTDVVINDNDNNSGETSSGNKALQDRVEQWVSSNDKDVLYPFELLLVTLPPSEEEAEKVRQQRRRRYLRLHIFHGLYDANSLGMIIAKAAALYLGTEGIESRTTFIDALIHGPLRSHAHTRRFWEDHLGGTTSAPCSFQPLPQLSPNPSTTDISVRRSVDFSSLLQPASRALNVTNSAIVQALWTSVLRSRYYSPHHQPDSGAGNAPPRPLTIGIIVFGRAIDVENAEHVVGPLFNTLPFSISPSPSSPPLSQTTWASLALQCHAFHTATLPFQHVPLRDIQKWCSAGKPLFDTLFSCQHEPLPSPAGDAGLWTEVEEVTTSAADYPLAFEATLRRDGRMELMFVAQAGVADEETLEGMLDGFEEAMGRMAADLDGAVMVGSATAAASATVGGIDGMEQSQSTRSTFRGPPLARSSVSAAREEQSDDATVPGLFEWTETALILRGEIAALAGVLADAVAENTGLLELGLDSIDTIKLAARLRKRGVLITNSQLVRGQTIRQFVQMVRRADDGAAGGSATTAVGSTSAHAQQQRQGGQSLLEEASAALGRYFFEQQEDPDQNITATTAAAAITTAPLPLGWKPEEVEAILPPTPLQDAMVADMVRSGFWRYFNHDVMELSADVDVARLRVAWETVVASSPILRTVFVQVEGTEFDFAHCQVVIAATAMVSPWREVTIPPPSSGHDGNENDGGDVDDKAGIAAEIENVRIRAEEAAGASDIFNLTLLRTSEEGEEIRGQEGNGKQYLILSTAHALYDGWSLSLLHADVQAAYFGTYSFSSPRPSYLSHLDRILRSSTPEAHDFWADSLTGATPTVLRPRSSPAIPTPPPPSSDSASASAASSRRVIHRLETPSSTPLSSLASLTCRLAVSAQVVGQVCFAAALSRRVSALDVTFGSVLSGRDGDGEEEADRVDQLLFPIMNTVAVRAVLHGSVAELLRYAQENAGGVREFMHFPLRKAVRLAGASGGVGGGGGGLFNTLFIMQKRMRNEDVGGEEDSEGGDGGEKKQALGLRSVDGDAAVEYPLCVEMELVGGDGGNGGGQAQVVWRTACDDAFFSEADARELLRDLDTALAFLVESSADASILSSTSSSATGGEAVSVCGLPPFRPRGASPTATETSGPVTEGSTLVNDYYGDGNNGEEKWTPLEGTIREVLAGASGVDVSVVKRAHGLYNLGLDSISAIKVSAMLRRKGVELKVRDLLRAESVVDMAAFASEAEESKNQKKKKVVEKEKGDTRAEAQRRADEIGTPDDTPASLDLIPERIDAQTLLRNSDVDMKEIEAVYPASPTQVHLISVWQNTEGEVFFPTFRYKATGKATDKATGISGASVEVVRSAWTALVREMPILRTAFLATGNKAMPFLQIVLKPDDDEYIAATFCDATGDHRQLRSDGGEARSIGRRKISSSPLVRLTASTPTTTAHNRLGQEWSLAMKIHHALYDGFSLPSLMGRLEQLLTHACDNDINSKRPGPTGVGSRGWKTLLATRAIPEMQQSREQFWTRYLQGAVPTPFHTTAEATTDDAAPATTTQSGGRVAKFIPHAIPDVSSLKAFASSHGVSVQACFLAVVARFLAGNNRESAAAAAPVDEVVLGIYLANRDDTEEDNALMYYPALALVPLRVRGLAAMSGRVRGIAETAGEIQRDIREISSEGRRSAVGLWEIERGTGVRINCFVNFLSIPALVPGFAGDDGGGNAQGPTVRVLQQAYDASTPVQKEDMATVEGPHPGEFPWMQPNCVADAFPDAVDVEAALNAHGGLDIGVFGPKSTLHGEDEAGTVIDALVSLVADWIE